MAYASRVVSIRCICTSGQGGWQLIVNKDVGQWGTEYDAAHDLARVPLHVRTLNDPVESLSMYLIPALDAEGAPRTMPHGTLKIVWEKTELSADWKIDAIAP